MIRIAALGAVLSLALAALPTPARSQYYKTETIPPKIVKLGTHTSAVAGTGKVRVQVLVKPDGSHVVTRIISSTNHGDDAAAREIAQTSTYRPAMRGGKPIIYFYDPIFRFNGRSVAGYQGPSGSGSRGTGGGGGSIDAMLRSGRYNDAKSAAQSALATRPNDSQLLQQLAAADYYLHDYEGAADAFSRAGAISHVYLTVAASAFANAAVRLGSEQNPSAADTARSLQYARRAVQLDHGTNSRFALGVAQLANKQYADALATLQVVHAAVFANARTDTATRYGVDQRLLAAYIGANDMSGAQGISTEMRRLEPSNNYPTQELGSIYINQGNDALAAKNYTQALALYQRAVALGDATVSVAAYDRSANVILAEPHPDPVQVKSYADEALALNPNDAAANYFDGVALFYQYQSQHTPNLKQQSLTYLNKADSLAKAAGNQQQLVQAIENAIRQVNAAGGIAP